MSATLTPEKLDEVTEPGGPEHELPDVDRGEAPADPFQDDVEPVPVGEHRVDERLTEVDAAAAGLQHPLHQLLVPRMLPHRIQYRVHLDIRQPPAPLVGRAHGPLHGVVPPLQSE